MAAAPSRHADNARILAAFQAGDTAAAERLLSANENLVRKAAGAFVSFARSMTLDDLLQEGRLSLLRAARLFDETRGNAFSTYATYAIRRAIRRAIEQQDALIYVPGYQQERRQEGLPACDLSLDARASAESEDRLGELLPAPDDTEGEALGRLQVEEALALLPARERFIIEQRAAGVTLLQLAGVLKCSKEKVRRMERGARARLAEVIGEVSPSRLTTRCASADTAR